MEIKVFGSPGGCATCAKVENMVQEIVATKTGEITVQKVANLQEMMLAGILSVPAITIDGKLKCTGKVPSREEIESWIIEAQNNS